jgi:hypothetical protein
VTTAISEVRFHPRDLEPTDLDKDIQACLDAIESEGPGCIEWEILKRLIAEKEKE